MAIQVYLAKRHLKGKRRNGQRLYRWAMRWKDPTTGEWRCESTATADRTQAEELQKAKWAEVNGLADPLIQPAVEAPQQGPTWDECRDALRRAMEADNMRPSYVANAILTFNGVKKIFPTDGPADITPDMANEYKRRRSEGDGEGQGVSAWSLKGDLSTLKAVFGKWLGRECGLLKVNPFADVQPPKCDDPEVRIVTADETQSLLAWLGERWNNWALPAVYLDVASILGWRATEIASIREDGILADGYVRVAAESSKTRRQKFGWLPAELHAELRDCAAGGWAFGKFSDDLRRLLMLWKRQPHHAARVGTFSPGRLVAWLQREVARFHDDRADEAKKENLPTPERFTLHDFRRTAITGMQMAGVSEKEASVMVGVTPEVMRRHYEKLDKLAIARRNVERRLGSEGRSVVQFQTHQSLRARCARPTIAPIDQGANEPQTVTA